MFRRWKLSRRRRLEKGPWIVSVLGFATLVVLNAIHGADLDAVAYCPHGPDEGCGCREPRTGLAREVERQLGQSIDYAASWTIGDKLSDLGFGMALGTRTALLRSRYWSNGELERPPDLIAGCLEEAVRFLLDGLA